MYFSVFYQLYLIRFAGNALLLQIVCFAEKGKMWYDIISGLRKLDFDYEILRIMKSDPLQRRYDE